GMGRGDVGPGGRGRLGGRCGRLGTGGPAPWSGGGLLGRGRVIVRGHVAGRSGGCGSGGRRGHLDRLAGRRGAGPGGHPASRTPAGATGRRLRRRRPVLGHGIGHRRVVDRLIVVVVVVDEVGAAVPTEEATHDPGDLTCGPPDD